MTIGEKIIHLRIANGVSQEKLAKILNVTRQSVSKWESDDSLPQIDNVIELCKIFNVTADELLNRKIILHKNAKTVLPLKDGAELKYFGTDGFRGETNKDLTADHAYKIGRFLGWFFSNPKYNKQKLGYKPTVVIGKDTRLSSYMFEYCVAAGLTASGANVKLLHVTTTPSVSYVIRQDCFDCGVMITASHNPFYDNGIKIINSDGEKIDDGIAKVIEYYLDGELKKLDIKGKDLPFAERENVGSIEDYSSGRNRYIGYLISLAKHSFKDYKIGLDCSNGASWMIAKSVFTALGAHVSVINDEPNGTNINKDAGSTHIEFLKKFVRENDLDFGFAFDGDADRCIAVDENGDEVDGDKIIYILAKKMKAEGSLKNNTVVTTVMSNSGLTKALKEIGVKNVQTAVGDRFVYEKMLEENYVLGGEQSGHVIIRKYATTGDGILTAIMLTEQVIESKMKLSELASNVTLLPQKMKSVRVTDKATVANDEIVLAKFKEINEEIGDDGRAILRQSGTEPVIRIMIECSSLEKCEEYIERIFATIKKRGYVCE
ncbi:MAG TPA: phosphoglucosamine mutase [Clostridiales bacterium]|nr:phosphoglucosamine mutase [Clostridiales bacterium]